MAFRSPLVLVVTLRGRPRAKPRGRTPKDRYRPVSLTGAAKRYAQALERAARAVVLKAGESVVQQAFASRALSVSILWQFPTPHQERWGTLHTPRPDEDNLTKMVLDCLMKAGALGGDDSRVATGQRTKLWGPSGMVAVRVELGENPKAPVDLRRAESLSAPPPWLVG
jgi:Holliday junction resolvase RusA-like endonuclease